MSSYCSNNPSLRKHGTVRRKYRSFGMLRQFLGDSRRDASPACPRSRTLSERPHPFRLATDEWLECPLVLPEPRDLSPGDLSHDKFEVAQDHLGGVTQVAVIQVPGVQFRQQLIHQVPQHVREQRRAFRVSCCTPTREGILNFSKKSSDSEPQAARV